MVMRMFFDEAYLKQYLQEHGKDVFEAIDLSTMLEQMLAEPAVDAALVSALEELSQKPEGMMLNMLGGMFGGVAGLVPQLKPMLIQLAPVFGKMLKTHFNPATAIPVDKVIAEVER